MVRILKPSPDIHTHLRIASKDPVSHWCDGSADKDVGCQVSQPESNPRDPHCESRDPTPTSYPLISIVLSVASMTPSPLHPCQHKHSFHLEGNKR